MQCVTSRGRQAPFQQVPTSAVTRWQQRAGRLMPAAAFAPAAPGDSSAAQARTRNLRGWLP